MVGQFFNVLMNRLQEIGTLAHTPSLILVTGALFDPKIIPLNLFGPCRTRSVKFVIETWVEPLAESVCTEIKVEVGPVSVVGSVIQKSVAIKELI